MSGADLFGLIVSALVCIYLLYALLRGEKFY
jgi:K+-transporting ATPase KdpF subunit